MSKIKIIAEIGINHDGKEDKAMLLIDQAAASGSQAVKFQYRNLENAYSDAVREIGDEILLNEINKTFLTPAQLLKLSHYAKQLGLEVGISFFDEKDVLDFGSDIDIFDFFKVPSVELSNPSLIDAMMGLDRHLYISTGCHNESEIDEAFNRLPETGWTPLHCTSNYPAALQNARLGYITYLKEKWNREVGYSSHDDHWEVCLLAMQLGAKVIERHITFDSRAEGLDHSTSSTVGDFDKIARFAKNFDLLTTGNIPRVPNQGELLNRQNLGRSFFALKDLAEGHVVQTSDLVYRSPNIGLNKTNIGQYLGKALKTKVDSTTPLTHSKFYQAPALPSNVIEYSKRAGLSLPVRLHDLNGMENQFPIGAFEFHLSYGEVLSDIDCSKISATNRYSIHLPDYINSVQLMDPFSRDDDQKRDSLDILERTVSLAEQLQDLTGRSVPVVGSFSVVHTDREGFFSDHAALLRSFQPRGVQVLPQWLPPIAWYFGGSVNIEVINDLADVDFIRKNNIDICMDICHMILGRNCFGFSTDDLIHSLRERIQHIHIADAAGIDGEGLAIGDGEPENLALIKSVLDYDCLKVVEVWQGHFDQGAGFRQALTKLTELFDE